MLRPHVALGLALVFLLFIACSCDSKNSGTLANPYAGNYAGTYQGTTNAGAGNETGTWTAVCNDDGAVTVTIVSPALGNVPGTGTITTAGQMSVTCSGTGQGGPYTITWVGTWVRTGTEINGSGTWTSTSGDQGTWVGHLS